MTPRIALDNYYVVLFSIIVVAFSLFVCLYIFLKARKSSLLYYYILTQLMLVVWTFSKILKTASPNIELRWFFIVIQYLGICLLTIFFVIFAYVYAKGRIPNKRVLLLSCIPPASCFLVVITNPIHMSFYSYFDRYEDQFGVLFYLHQFIVYVYLLIGIILCSKDFGKQVGQRKMKSALIAVAILFPLFVNLLYVFKVLKLLFNIRLPMDITPIACMISLLIFTFVALRYRFLDLTPIAYRTALEHTPEGIVLINNDGNITEYNKAFIDRFGSADSKTIRGIIEEYAGYGSKDITLELEKVVHLRLFKEPILNDNRIVGTMLRFVDITIIKNIIEELSENNQALYEANRTLELKTEALRQLTAMRVRSFMAKEVHDILGHSVVLVISMLEVALIHLKKGIKDSNGYLDHCIKLLRESLKEIENAVRDHKQKEIENKNLIKRLTHIANQFETSRVKIDLTFQGSPVDIPLLHTENISKICREGVTNAVRHGKADLINIILRLSSAQYELFVIDNGTGCAKITKGMGLMGMEERAEQIGATLRLGSYEDGGFTITLIGNF